MYNFTSYLAIPVTGSRLWGCETSRLPYVLGSWLIYDDEIVRLAHQPHFTPPLYEDSWYSFLLWAESTPGPQYGWKGFVN
jgi:hypothetical protein